MNGDRFNWDDLDDDLADFLLSVGYFRALRAERSDPYDALARTWFGKRVDEDAQCRAFMVDTVVGHWRRYDLESLGELIEGPCYGLHRNDRIWEVKGRNDEG